MSQGSTVSSTSSQRSQPQPQRARWAFTLNGYDVDKDWCEHFRTANFNIKRAVFGFEVAPTTGTRHLQGYAEFNRTVRLAFVRRVLPQAHWEPAERSALQNYIYCTKSNNFDFVGDFAKEVEGKAAGRKAKLPVASIVNGLLDKSISSQVKLSNEYSSNFSYFNYIVPHVKGVTNMHKLFNIWKAKRLYPWQYAVLKRALGQNDRQVLWVTDRVGNNGKSYLASFLKNLYQFQIFDGTLSTRDICMLLQDDLKGIVMDVARASETTLNYTTIESLKNGYVVSGKYNGTVVTFAPVPVIVMANFYPDLTKLSEDRFDIHIAGRELLADMSKEAVINPGLQHPFVEPPPLPDLSGNIVLSDLLLQRGYLAQEQDRQQREERQMGDGQQADGRPGTFGVACSAYILYAIENTT